MTLPPSSMTIEVELETSRTTREPTTVKELTKRMTTLSERIPSHTTTWVIGIVTSIKPSSQFRIGKNLISLIDC